LFERAHHRRIASLLASLDADAFLAHQCYFGGGTAIAMLHGEYRESRDVDFLVSALDSYRELRGIVTTKGVSGLFTEPVKLLRDARTDQYGIRTLIEIEGVPIKFEIVLEARVSFERSHDEHSVCGVRVLSHVDLVAEKLLANSDRWADDEVDSRDLIDLAMMLADGRIPQAALQKAGRAYGTIMADLEKAKTHIERPGQLLRCMANLQMSQPLALVLDRIRKLKPAPERTRRAGP